MVTDAQVPVAVQQLPQHKVKVKKVGQRACNEKDEKGKICGGHLKRGGPIEKCTGARTAKRCTCRIPRTRMGSTLRDVDSSPCSV